jgi:Pyruvate/2-oxoacid:ferredoxin oxidoreductase delta subunit
LQKSFPPYKALAKVLTYWKHPKATFATAKEWAFQCLDACPDEVIQWFVNRSERFLKVYCKGNLAVWGNHSSLARGDPKYI